MKKKKSTLALKTQEAISLTGTFINRVLNFSKLGLSYSGNRELYTILGYETGAINFEKFYLRYSRQDIAKRIIDAPVKATWRKAPEVVESEENETQFEKDWATLVKEKKIFNYLARVDKLSCIGQFAVLLMGFDDNSELEQEVKSAKELLYLRPFSETNVAIKTWVKDNKNPRYGLPEIYTLTLSDSARSTKTTLYAHHSRCIHIAEDMLEDDFYGVPKLEAIFNRLQDLEKICGGSAEMFWRGAHPGMALTEKEGYTMPAKGSTDETTLKDDIEEYIHNLKRYLVLSGVDVKELAMQVADPNGHISAQLDLIAGATGIPKRILIGSERGELASSQDESNWNNLIDERRKNFVEPIILRPFIDKMINVGILSQPKNDYQIKWPDLQVPSEKEEADVAFTKTDAIAKYVMSIGADMIIPVTIFLRDILKLPKATIDEITEIIDQQIKDEEDTSKDAQVQSGREDNPSPDNQPAI